MKRKTTDTLLILWWIAMFTVTSIPGSSLPEVDVVNFDKLVHVFIYGILAFLLTVAFTKRGIVGLKRSIFVILIGLAYSVFDEWHQPFVGRTCSILDIIANFIGIGLVTLVSLFVKPKVQEQIDAD